MTNGKVKRITQDEVSRAEAVLKAHREQLRADALREREQRQDRIDLIVQGLVGNLIEDPRGWAAREHEERKLLGFGKGMTDAEAEVYYLGSLDYSLRVVLSALLPGKYEHVVRRLREIG